MRLTDRTDFALRVLMLLAADDGRRTVAEMARLFDVSAHHLSKVVQDLHALGWVETSRGRSGGAELAVDPARLSVGEVVRAMEPDFALVECLREEGACPLEGPCALRAALKGARDAFLAELDATTLAALVRGREKRLVQIVVRRAS